MSTPRLAYASKYDEACEYNLKYALPLYEKVHLLTQKGASKSESGPLYIYKTTNVSLLRLFTDTIPKLDAEIKSIINKHQEITEFTAATFNELTIAIDKLRTAYNEFKLARQECKKLIPDVQKLREELAALLPTAKQVFAKNLTLAQNFKKISDAALIAEGGNVVARLEDPGYKKFTETPLWQAKEFLDQIEYIEMIIRSADEALEDYKDTRNIKAYDRCEQTAIQSFAIYETIKAHRPQVSVSPGKDSASCSETHSTNSSGSDSDTPGYTLSSSPSGSRTTSPAGSPPGSPPRNTTPVVMLRGNSPAPSASSASISGTTVSSNLATMYSSAPKMSADELARLREEAYEAELDKLRDQLRAAEQAAREAIANKQIAAYASYKAEAAQVAADIVAANIQKPRHMSDDEFASELKEDRLYAKVLASQAARAAQQAADIAAKSSAPDAQLDINIAAKKSKRRSGCAVM